MQEKYSEIWDKVRNTKKNGFDSEPIYDEKYLKTEIKFHEEKNEYKFSKEGAKRRFSMHLPISNIDWYCF